MEVNDWSAAGKDSFTTPGGTFVPPPAGSAKTYQFDTPSGPRQNESVRPEARTGLSEAAAGQAASPFAREPQGAQPWYAGVQAQLNPSASTGAQAAPAVIVNQNGGAKTVVPLQPQISGGPQVYTIQLPAAPKQPAPKKQSLWWLPLALIAALLLGLLLGALAYPLLSGAAESPASQAVSGSEGETAAVRVYRENVDTVVSILVGPSSDTGTSSISTGFLLSSDGYLLTNAHVVRSGGSVTVTLSDGRQFPAQVLVTEEIQSDLALLKIEATGLRFVTLGDSDTLQVGDPVFTIGNPLGNLSSSLSAGYLSAGPREVNTGSTTLTMLQTNAAINKGNSGGPLFDAAGRVVGVVTAKYSSVSGDSTVEGLGFALPVNDVMEIVTPWLEAAKRAE